MIEKDVDENGANPSQVRWERMAEPQSDQYDSRVTLAFAQGTGYRRREPGGSPSFLDRPGCTSAKHPVLPYGPRARPSRLSECRPRRSTASPLAQVHSQFVVLVRHGVALPRTPRLRTTA